MVIFGIACLTLRYMKCQLWSLMASVRDPEHLGSKLLSVRFQLE